MGHLVLLWQIMRCWSASMNARTFGRPALIISYTSYRPCPSQNELQHLIVCCTVSTLSPNTSANWQWMALTVAFLWLSRIYLQEFMSTFLSDYVGKIFEGVGPYWLNTSQSRTKSLRNGIKEPKFSKLFLAQKVTQIESKIVSKLIRTFLTLNKNIRHRIKLSVVVDWPKVYFTSGIRQY